MSVETHDVTNQPTVPADCNAYTTDRPLQEAIAQFGGSANATVLSEFGALAGSRQALENGRLANQHPPEFRSHDRYGNRIDQVDFHPSYHDFMAQSTQWGLHALDWNEPTLEHHLTRTALFYLQNQVEAGHCCPITMTHACIPTLMHEPELAAAWVPKILACHYDGANKPDSEKTAVTIGMAMTEKQGGSDVRTNTTQAELIPHTQGQHYVLTGHKYFVSAPMSDAFLTLAQTPKGLTCFLMPRWRPDGSKNSLFIQQIKDKMGNVSNATSEMELRDTFAWKIGESGRGIANILQMVSLTRFDCMVGSAGGMRRALSEAIYHADNRQAFGDYLSSQPLMTNVLADLAIESDAALWMSMRIGRAQALANASEEEQLLSRIAVAIGKYWVCKRTPEHAYEAMEVLGGSGVMESTDMPRLFRESPVNAIWEGSSNVQCLDILRAMQKSPDSQTVFFDELHRAKGLHANYDNALTRLIAAVKNDQDIQYRARDTAGQMALLFQGAQLLMTGNQTVAEAFCASRLSKDRSLVYGALPVGLDTAAIIDRARRIK